jgi:hypothetical protein
LIKKLIEFGFFSVGTEEDQSQQSADPLSLQEIAFLIVETTDLYGEDVGAENFLDDVFVRLRSRKEGSFLDQLVSRSRLPLNNAEARRRVYVTCSTKWEQLKEALKLEVKRFIELRATGSRGPSAQEVKREGVVQLPAETFTNLVNKNELGFRALLAAVSTGSNMPKQCTPVRAKTTCKRFLRYYVNCRHPDCFRMVIDVMVPATHDGDLQDYQPEAQAKYRYNQLPTPHKMEKPRHLRGEARQFARDTSKGKGASVLHERMEAQAFRGEVPQYSVPTINALRNTFKEDVTEAIREAGCSSIPSLIKYYEQREIDYIWSYEPGESFSVAFGDKSQLELFKKYGDGTLRLDATGEVVRRPKKQRVVRQGELKESDDEESGERENLEAPGKPRSIRERVWYASMSRTANSPADALIYAYSETKRTSPRTSTDQRKRPRCSRSRG